MKTITTTLLFAAMLTAGCNSTDNTSKTKIEPHVVHGVNIEPVPAQFSDYSRAGYDRYVGVKAPNGKSIHILIMDRLTEHQIVKAVNVLKHYLEPVSGTEFGRADQKAKIANTMANNHAVLKLMNYHDAPKYNDDLEGQPLFEEEIQVEGGKWYVNQDYNEHRDASYEEILHLVHDYGIGVYNSPEENEMALPIFAKRFNTIQQNSLHSAYNPPADILKEWQDEVSVDQEYFAAVIDSYYGLWGAFQGEGMWGMYKVKTRQDFDTLDSNAKAITEQIFAKTLTYDAYIDDSFTGTFKMRFDAKAPYTHHSQYLTKLTLSGSNDSDVQLNQYDNIIKGNSGENTVVASGTRAEYTIERDSGGQVRLIDTISDRDGANTLSNIEKIQFTDQTVTL
ncbi:hypothetical protein [Vibrio sinaloensis]|uniref:Lipoprotein n=1 Tax=Photobacterium sp. (strain ATCC 43367) TaxID=379097 RepID=A0A0A5I1U7_PHOS4|nr:hypothetical protein [Vibrio sinaloensis]KGY10485.1 hypothetical protein NM06_01355 [Vibrio sinaloensis]